jgi:hypothetical protein
LNKKPKQWAPELKGMHLCAKIKMFHPTNLSPRLETQSNLPMQPKSQPPFPMMPSQKLQTAIHSSVLGLLFRNKSMRRILNSSES